MDKQTITYRRQIRYLTVFFMLSLTISGLTAMPAREGVGWLVSVVPQSWAIQAYLMSIREALYRCDSWLFYGYDWLAFAHIVIAVLFIGVLRDPVRNIWVVEWGMIACMMILPFAFVMGQVRGIPLWWRLVDGSFGLVGIIPLWFIRDRIRRLEHIISIERLNTIF